MKAIPTILLTFFVLMLPYLLHGQSTLESDSEEKAKNDTTIVENTAHYKTAEIAFEIESTARYIKDKNKQIKSYQNTEAMDTSFTKLNARIIKDFEEFGTFNKLNLSKFFLQNKKRLWLNYKSQLTHWQTDLSFRIGELMQVSDRIKEKEKRWVATSNQPDIKLLPKNINSRISRSINDLHTLEKNLFEVVGILSLLESRITDQIIDLEQHISIIDELQKNYRVTILKVTHPVIWKIKLRDSYEGTVGSRLKKAWYENSKSLKDSLPSLKEYVGDFIAWSLFFIVVILGFHYWYLKRCRKKRSSDDDINELIIRNPKLSILYLVLFVFIILFNNIPLALSGIVVLVLLVITYFLLQQYFSVHGKRLILTFVILLFVNTVEIVFWYFGSFARLYLLLEAGLGIILVSYFVGPKFTREYKEVFRYKLVVDLLRYPIFALYVSAFLFNFFGFQNLSVLLLKTGTQLSTVIIVIIGAWEISKSSLYILFKIANSYKLRNSSNYLPLLKSRLTLFLTLFFSLVLFDTFLNIVELDTPFYEFLDHFMKKERNVGSFVFAYASVFQFLLIMMITWGLSAIVMIVFNEGNFRKTQRLRGVPAVISTTLKLIIALSGFFLALSGAGIDLTKISILIGAFGVGIGFGLQNIVNNFISGLILIYERPIQVEDTIEINTLMGQVKSIGIRSSKVRTFDGAEVVVPNSLLVSDQLINWTLSDDRRRIEIIVGVKYGTDPTKVIEILKEVAISHELVSKDPEPRVLFNEFGDSSLNFRLLVWVLFEHGIQIKSDLSVAIDKAFKENNIEIPFPQLDLHVKDTPIEKETTSGQIENQPGSKPLIADGSGLNQTEGELGK